MSYYKVCEELQAAWDAVSTKWSAEAKSNYFNQLYLSLLSEAEAIYRRNDNLESYAENCIRSVHG